MPLLSAGPGPWLPGGTAAPARRELLGALLALPLLLYRLHQGALPPLALLPPLLCALSVLSVPALRARAGDWSFLSAPLSALALGPFLFAPETYAPPALPALLSGLGALGGALLGRFLPEIFRFPALTGIILAQLPRLLAAGPLPAPFPAPEGLSLLLLAPYALHLFAAKEIGAVQAPILFLLWDLGSILLYGPEARVPGLWLCLILCASPVVRRFRPKLPFLLLFFPAGLWEASGGSALFGLSAGLFSLLYVILLGPLSTLAGLWERRSLLQETKDAPPRTENPGLRPGLFCRRGEGGVRKIARHPPNLGCAILDSSCPGGPFACREACLGLGDCAALCPAGAISLSLGTPRADLSLCRGCGVCERSCPRGLWRLIPREAKAAVFCSGSARMREMDSLCRLGCLGCGLCRKACPLGALGKPGLLGPPQVDYALCRMDAPCRMECREACPRGLPGPAFQPENGDG